MKKSLFVAVLAVALLLSFGVVQAHAQWDYLVWKTGPMESADWWTQVGGVRTTLSADGKTLEVLMISMYGYELTETHVAVASSLDGIPHSKGGPTPGRFEYGTEHDPWVNSYTYEVDVSDIPGDIYLVAHANVVRLADCRVETGWTTGCKVPMWAYPGSSWARFFTYQRVDNPW